MEITSKSYKMFYNNNRSWKDRTFVAIIFLYHKDIINRESFITLCNNLYNGETPKTRKTYYAKPIDKWYDHEPTDYIFNDIFTQLIPIETSIPMETFIKYVNLGSGYKRNSCINLIFDIIVKSCLINLIYCRTNNNDMNNEFLKLFKIDLSLETYTSFFIKEEVYHYDSSYESHVDIYQTLIVNNIMKKLLHKVAKSYFKKGYHLNPGYTKTEELDFELSENQHIFEYITPFGMSYSNSFIENRGEVFVK